MTIWFENSQFSHHLHLLVYSIQFYSISVIKDTYISNFMFHVCHDIISLEIEVQHLFSMKQQNPSVFISLRIELADNHSYNCNMGESHTITVPLWILFPVSFLMFMIRRNCYSK